MKRFLRAGGGWRIARSVPSIAPGQIMLSWYGDGSIPRPAHDSSIYGNAYLWLDGHNGKAVTWKIDGATVHVAPASRKVPLGGAAPSGRLLPFDTTTLTDGPHTITAVRADGVVSTATLYVFNTIDTTTLDNLLKSTSGGTFTVPRGRYRVDGSAGGTQGIFSAGATTAHRTNMLTLIADGEVLVNSSYKRLQWGSSAPNYPASMLTMKGRFHFRGVDLAPTYASEWHLLPDDQGRKWEIAEAPTGALVTNGTSIRPAHHGTCRGGVIHHGGIDDLNPYACADWLWEDIVASHTRVLRGIAHGDALQTTGGLRNVTFRDLDLEGNALLATNWGDNDGLLFERVKVHSSDRDGFSVQSTYGYEHRNVVFVDSNSWNHGNTSYQESSNNVLLGHQNAALAAAVDATQTSFAVTITADEATNAFVPFDIQIDSEKMLVTAYSGTTYTVTRGHAGTTPAAHASAAPITRLAQPAPFGFGAGMSTSKPAGRGKDPVVMVGGSRGSAASGAASVSVGRPGNGNIAGRPVIVVLASAGDQALTPAATGWTLLADSGAAPSGSPRLWVFGRTIQVGAAEPGSYVFTITGAGDVIGQSFSLRNVDPTQALKGFTAPAPLAAGAPVDAPAVVIAADGDQVFRVTASRGFTTTTLIEATTTSSTSWTVADASAITVGQMLQVLEEQVQVTAKNGNVLTVTRGIDNTNKRAASAGTVVYPAWSVPVGLQTTVSTYGIGVVNLPGTSLQVSFDAFPAQREAGPSGIETFSLPTPATAVAGTFVLSNTAA